MVHIYTIGLHCRTTPGTSGSFSYISLFHIRDAHARDVETTFLQLFFGWEAVGVVSYLLIGFWFDPRVPQSGPT